ncbi:hypothetical protein R80B4_01019 [Fibrobacteres bacterium R8-0-B4]
MLSIPGQRKPVVTKTTWVERSIPVLTSLALLLMVLIWRAVEAVK